MAGGRGGLIIQLGDSPEALKRKRVMEGNEDNEGSNNEEIEAMEDFIGAVKEGEAETALDILRDLVSMMK